MPDEKKFYQMDLAERLQHLQANSDLTKEELAVFDPQGGLSTAQADLMIENGIGVFGLPLGIAQRNAAP